MQELKESKVAHFRDKVIQDYSEALWDYLTDNRIIFDPIRFTPEQDTPIYLIRHAMAKKNFDKAVERATIGGKVDKEKRRAKLWKEALIDSGVNLYGRMHIECIQSYYNQFKFKKVYVSSLRRSMQSVLVMFTTHPNREDIEVIVEPLLRQSLDMANDIPAITLKEFYQFQQELKKQGIKLNLEKVLNASQPNAHVMDSFMNERGKADKQEFLKLIKEENISGEAITQRYIQFLLEKMEKIPDFRYESKKDVEERCQYIQKYLVEEWNKAKLEPDEKILAVTHSFIINNICKGKKDYVRTHHGQIFPMPLE